MNIAESHKVGPDGKTPLERVTQVLFVELPVSSADCDQIAAKIVEAMNAPADYLPELVRWLQQRAGAFPELGYGRVLDKIQELEGVLPPGHDPATCTDRCCTYPDDRASLECCPRCGGSLSSDGRHVDTGSRECGVAPVRSTSAKPGEWQYLGFCVQCWQEDRRRVAASFIVAGSGACDDHARIHRRR